MEMTPGIEGYIDLNWILIYPQWLIYKNVLELHPTDVDTHTLIYKNLYKVRQEMFNSASGVIITLEDIIYSGTPL